MPDKLIVMSAWSGPKWQPIRTFTITHYEARSKLIPLNLNLKVNLKIISQNAYSFLLLYVLWLSVIAFLEKPHLSYT